MHEVNGVKKVLNEALDDLNRKVEKRRQHEEEVAKLIEEQFTALQNALRDNKDRLLKELKEKKVENETLHNEQRKKLTDLLDRVETVDEKDLAKIVAEPIVLKERDIFLSSTVPSTIYSLQHYCNIEEPQFTNVVLLPKPGKEVAIIGRRGFENGEFTLPVSVAIDENEELVVVDQLNNRLQVFSSKSYEWKKTIAYKSSEDKSPVFATPSQIALTPSSEYAVADSGSGRVLIVSREGKLTRAIGRKGKELGDLSGPTGVAVDTDGNFYVSDSWNHRIQVFSFEGKFLRAFGKRGNKDLEFMFPSFLSFDENENLVVCDQLNHRIQIVDKQGNFVSKFGKKGANDGQLQHPRSVVVDKRQGNYIVADSNNHRIQTFDKHGNFLTSYGSNGTNYGEFIFPKGLAIDYESNVLLVCDSENNRLVSLQTILQ